MITPDSIPLWFFFPFLFIVVVLWITLEVRAAIPDPNPEYSRLDKLDGLDTRTD